MKQIQSAVSIIFVGFLAKPLSTETETRVESGIWAIGKGPEKKSERETLHWKMELITVDCVAMASEERIRRTLYAGALLLVQPTIDPFPAAFPNEQQ